MTRSDVIAELRRSACEDAAPYSQVLMVAWHYPLNWTGDYKDMADMHPDDLRTFFLLVACALEDGECP